MRPHRTSQFSARGRIVIEQSKVANRSRPAPTTTRFPMRPFQEYLS